MTDNDREIVQRLCAK